MKQKSFHFSEAVMVLLPLIWMGLIFYFSHQPAEQSAELSGGLVARLIEIFHLPFTEHFVRKAAHFTEYAVLGVLVFNAARVIFSGRCPWAALLVCGLYSVTDEVHQLFVPGRSCQLSDMLLDTAGAAVGILLWRLVLHLFGEKKRLRGIGR